MFEVFSKLAQANVNHYNEHPTAHFALTTAYGSVALVAMHFLTKRIAGVNN